jgi:serine phosphatase RsbU (regulator of sigma subunit)
LFLYTDGLLEARNAKGEIFGEEALSAALRGTASLTVGQAADRLIDAATQWARVPEDDLTVVICDFVRSGQPGVENRAE